MQQTDKEKAMIEDARMSSAKHALLSKVVILTTNYTPQQFLESALLDRPLRERNPLPTGKATRHRFTPNASSNRKRRGGSPLVVSVQLHNPICTG